MVVLQVRGVSSILRLSISDSADRRYSGIAWASSSHGLQVGIFKAVGGPEHMYSSNALAATLLDGMVVVVQDAG